MNKNAQPVSYEKDSYYETADILKQQLQQSIAEYGESDRRTLSCLERYVEALVNARMYDESLKYSAMLVRLLEEHYSDDDMWLAQAYSDHSHILSESSETLKYAEKAYSCAQQSGDEYLQMSCRNTLASAYRDNSMYEKAMTMYTELYNSCVGLYGEDNYNTVITKGNLAGTYYDLGDAVTATKLCREVVEWFGRNEGERSSEYLRELANLSYYLRASGDAEQALDTARSVYRLNCEVYGADSAVAVDRLEQLAHSYENMHRTRSAVDAMQQVFAWYEQNIFGNEYWYVRSALVLAEYRAYIGVCDDEDKLTELVYKYREYYEEMYIRLKASLDHTVSLIRYEKGDIDGAAESIREYNSSILERYGKDSRYTLSAVLVTAEMLCRCKCSEDCLQLCEDAKRLVSMFPDTSEELCRILCAEAVASSDIGDDGKALKLLSEASDIDVCSDRVDLALAYVYNMSDDSRAAYHAERSLNYRKEHYDPECRGVREAERMYNIITGKE